MYRTFSEIEEYILKQKAGKRIVLAGAHDAYSLDAVVHARRMGAAEGVLIGRTAEIRELLSQMGESAEDYEIISCDGDREAADLAVRMVREGQADIIMKGLMQSSDYLKAVLNREHGLTEAGSLLNQATVMEWPDRQKLLFFGDCGVNISPDLKAKAGIIRNIVKLAHSFGYEMPKVAVLGALETAKDSLPGSMDAKQLSELPWEDCVVGGPFALDNAVSEEAAAHKGISHPAAGKADILIMPDLNCGNIFTKGMTFFAHLKSGSLILGAEHPVIMTSRAHSAEDKYHSILCAVMQSQSR